MSGGEWTAADIAAYDQHLSGAASELDLLLEALRRTAGERGERQALADVINLVSYYDQSRVAGLLAVAMMRLAGFGQADRETAGR